MQTNYLPLISMLYLTSNKATEFMFYAFATLPPFTTRIKDFPNNVYVELHARLIKLSKFQNNRTLY